MPRRCDINRPNPLKVAVRNTLEAPPTFASEYIFVEIQIDGRRCVELSLPAYNDGQELLPAAWRQQSQKGICRLREGDGHDRYEEDGPSVLLRQPRRRRLVEDEGADIVEAVARRVGAVRLRCHVNSGVASVRVDGLARARCPSVASAIGFRLRSLPMWWAVFSLPLSLRLVEEMLMERGIVVSYETVRRWAKKFGRDYPRRLRR